MYGHTPPAVIAIDPALLTDCGGFQRLAWALHGQLQRRPVWVVVRAPADLDEASPGEQEVLLESYFTDPLDAPAQMPADMDEGAALVLQSHLRHLGVELPIILPPVPTQPHAVHSAIVPGPWCDAAALAKVLAAARVTAWSPETQWIPRSMDGIPFDSSLPGGPRLDGLPIDG